jgi:DNA-binding transcriptional MerR regulator
MGANDLILQLRNSGFSISSANSRLQIAPASKLTDELKRTIQQRKEELLAELEQESRRQKALAMLNSNPETQRAVIADADSHPEHVILTIALRQVAVFEMWVEKTKYQPWQLLELVDTHGSQATH